MKITVLQESLVHALSIVRPAVDPRPQPERAILGAVHMQAEGDILTLSASNGEISITTSIGCQVHEAGIIALPAHFLADTVTRLPAERIEIVYHVEGFTASLSCSGSSYEIRGYDPANFPAIPENSKGAATITIPGAHLAYMIRNVLVAVAKTNSRPALTGLNFTIEGDTLSLMSGDGFRLGFWEHTLPMIFDKPLSMIVPANSAVAIRQTFAEDEEVQITFLAGKNKQWGIFKGRYTTIVALLLDAAFPNIKSVLDMFDSPMTSITVDRQEFQNACQRIEPFSREMSFSIVFEVKDDGAGTMQQVRLAAQSQERGRGETFFPAHIEGNPARLPLNVAYLVQALREINAEQVVIDLAGDRKPVQISPLQQLDNDSCFHVVMPMDKDPEMGTAPKAKRSVNGKAGAAKDGEVEYADDESHLVSPYNRD